MNHAVTRKVFPRPEAIPAPSVPTEPDALRTPFGALLRAFRIEAGLSQYALARASHVDHSYVCRLESARPDQKREPTRNVVKDLVRGLKLNRDDTLRLYVAAGIIPEGARVTWES